MDTPTSPAPRPPALGLAAIADALGTAAIAAPDGTVLTVGGALARVFGEIGAPRPETLPAADCRRALANPSGVRLDRWVEGAAETRRFRVRLRPLPLGEEILVGAVYEDVTTEARRLDRLRDAVERAEELVSVVSDYVFTTDADGVLVEFLARTDAAGGLDAGALVGRSLWQAGAFARHPDYPDKRLPRPRQRAPLRRCLWTVTQGDRQHHLEIHAIPIFDREADRFAGFRGSATDITARLLAQFDATAYQEQLKATLAEMERQQAELRDALARARASDTAKSAFLAMMSHELRTPLNAIIGFAEMMQAGILGPLGNPQYEGYTGDILASAQHLLAIISDILDYAKMDAGHLPLDQERVDLAHLVGTSARLFEDRARARGIDLTATVDPELACDADPRRLKQVLINLLANAVKFTPEGGRITIAADRSGAGIAIRVADTGPGIAPEDVERVLQPFVQADGRLERLHEGTGLGLPLSRAIAEAHGGTLHLESPPEGGTTAVVRLPG
ncbi:MAG: hypothetical protein GVY27_10965 [Deinococcus-Thermus bacterium]|jgi:two-component system cell cycle sensor histidine kinase PleC|nr:hypothetical protein [Deinococcota bacterium]